MDWPNMLPAPGILGPPISEGDFTGLLPPAAADKYFRLCIENDAAKAALRAVADQRSEQREAKQEALAEIRKIKNEFTFAVGRTVDESHPSLTRLKAKVAAADVALARLELPYRKAAEKAEHLGRLVQAIRSWLGENARGTPFLPYAGPVSGLKKNETAQEGLQRLRRERDVLCAHKQALSVAPLPSADAKEIAAAYVDELVARGAPDVFDILESSDGKIAWPMRSPEVAQDGVPREARISFLYITVPDTAAMLAWLWPDRMIARLYEEIDLRADDRHAISNSEREQQLKEAAAAILMLERAEEAAIVAAEREGAGLLRRADADVRAVLGLA